jgi:hypothetical protein
MILPPVQAILVTHSKLVRASDIIKQLSSSSRCVNCKATI